jgi:hypothetical protein
MSLTVRPTGVNKSASSSHNDHLHMYSSNYILYCRVQGVRKLKYLDSTRKPHKILDHVSLMSTCRISNHIFLCMRPLKSKPAIFVLGRNWVMHATVFGADISKCLYI